jgi:hypothetical protein
LAPGRKKPALGWALGALLAPMLGNLLLIRSGEPYASAAVVWSFGGSFVAGIVCMVVVLPRIQLPAIAKILIGFVIMGAGTVAAFIGAVFGCSAGGMGH